MTEPKALVNQPETPATPAQLCAVRLRAICDWIDSHPDAPPPISINVSNRIYCGVYPKGREELAAFVHSIGSCRKVAWTDNDDFHFVVDLGQVAGDSLEIWYYTARQNVCEKVVVGHRQVEEKYIPGHIEEAHEEEVCEWRCTDPILADLEIEEP